MRVAIVAEHASSRFGGEALLPFNYFRLLRERGIEAWLIVHARTADELKKEFPDDLDRMEFVQDSYLQKLFARISHHLPRRLAESTFLFWNHLRTQFAQRRIVRRLVRRHRIDVIHQVMPVSPKAPSLMWGVGAAVVIGPLNGGMEYPEFYRRTQSRFVHFAIALARRLADVLNLVTPGKRLADVVLVANKRTRDALPSGVSGEVIELVENGVDLSIWSRGQPSPRSDPVTRFIFIGRLVDWKAVDIIIEAAKRMAGTVRFSLEIVGDGAMRGAWEELAHRLNLGADVYFSGWMSQEDCVRRLRESDVFVLPSLFECGGAVVLEAMAMALPVVATDWGGPSDYLDPSCGVLIPPTSRESLVDGFAEAMTSLSGSAELRTRLGQAGYDRVRRNFDWDSKIDEIQRIYSRAVERRTSPARAADRRGT
jgi:glycosyltransferase involved in cell wall biosynthesis